MKTTIMKPQFRLGAVVGTPAAVRAIADAGQTPDFFLRKHVAGDWGDWRLYEIITAPSADQLDEWRR